MSILLDGTQGIDFNDGSNQSTAATPYARKNLIINGDMNIAQRGTSATGKTTGGFYTVDRFWTGGVTAGTWTISQDTDTPSGQGFTTSLKMDCTTANASLSAGSYWYIEQKIEAQNCQHLKFGTSSAETLKVSFWVKSNKTGTYTFEIYRGDSGRDLSNTYTIDTADTWEKKTITINADSTGVINNDNGEGLRCIFWVVAGTTFTSGTLATSWEAINNANRVSSSNVNLADSTSNYINITGVQLEVNDSASDFEFVPYDMELARCKRYYSRLSHDASGQINIANLTCFTTTQAYGAFIFPVEMRSSPSIDIGAAGDFCITAKGANYTCTNVAGAVSSKYSSQIAGIVASGLTVGQACWLRFLGSTVDLNEYIEFDAEL